MAQHVTAQVATDHGDMLSWTRPLSRYSRHNIYNLSRPEKSLILLAGLSAEAGGYATGERVAETRVVKDDRSKRPGPVEHPVVFESASDADYVKILTHISAAKARLDEIKRFDMPGFRPNEHYVREMKRYGVLAGSFGTEDPVDVYATDQVYFRMFHRPADNDGGQ